MYDTILIPTDGSEHALRAAKTGLALARSHDADVHVISVVDPGPFADIRLPGDAAPPSKALEERATAFGTDIVDRADDLEVTTVVRHGVPGTEILEYATDIGADVIVMGSHGRGGLHRMAVGSVTDHVIRFGNRQVLVCPRDEA